MNTLITKFGSFIFIPKILKLCRAFLYFEFKMYAQAKKSNIRIILVQN